MLLSNCSFTETDLMEEPKTNPIVPLKLSLIDTWEMSTVSALAWHPMQPIVAIAGWPTSSEQYLQLYDVQTGQELWSRRENVGGVVFAPDGDTLVVTPIYEAFVQIVGVDDGQILSVVESANCSGGEWLFFSEAEDTLLTGHGARHVNRETTLNRWQLKSGSCQQIDSLAGFLGYLDVNAEFDRVIVSYLAQDHHVFVKDLAAEIELCSLAGDFGVFVPFTNLFVISNDEKLIFYDTFSCQIVKEYAMDALLRGYIDFSPDGEIFVTAGEYLQLWSTATGILLFQEELPDNFSGSNSRPRLVFSPDGQYLLAVFSNLGADDINATIQIWQVLSAADD